MLLYVIGHGEYTIYDYKHHFIRIFVQSSVIRIRVVS